MNERAMKRMEACLCGFREQKPIFLIRLENRAGHRVELSSFGGRILGIEVPDRRGHLENVVLNYPTITEYYNDPYYLGATIGPIANRIRGARYAIDGQCYTLDPNDGWNCNHSGKIGLDKVIFDHELQPDSGVTLHAQVSRSSAYSANAEVWVRYAFTDDDELTVDYHAEADAEAYMTLTNHSYFNLSGQACDISRHRFQTDATRHLILDEEFLPTGVIAPAEGIHAFPSLRALGRVPRNTYYIFDGEGPHTAVLQDDNTGRRLDVHTTQPGVLLYSGSYLGGRFRPFQGVCLETQGFPDAPSRPGFPSIRIGRNKPYRHRTIYKFSTI